MGEYKENTWKIGDKNKSLIYIMPMLGNINAEFIASEGSSNPRSQHRNVFVGDNCFVDLEDKILMLYRFSSNTKYIEFENYLQQHELFELMYEPDSKHTMFVFRVPSDYIKDYKLILESKYSKLSDSYKKHIISFHGLGADSKTTGILFQTNKRLAELEAEINEGLPKIYWTKIPSNVELEGLFNLEIECYQEKYKEAITKSLSPSGDFNVEI